jgi:hypothetical protein
MISLFPEFSPMRVKYKDIFDMKAFYEALHEWLQEYEWKDYEDQIGPGDHWESFYGERVGQGGAKEVWIRWRVYKKAPESDQLTYYLDIDFHCIALISTEVVVQGRKIKTNKGEVEIIINSYIEKKYESQFEKNPFLKHFKDIFTNRIYKKNLEQRKKELYQEIYAFNNFIKQWFKLKRYLPYEEVKGFFPSQAWPSHLKEE